MNYSIRVSNIGKVFKFGKSHKTFFSYLKSRSNVNGSHSSTLKALDNVSFNIVKGEKVGLIGNNGAGKTTLLRTLAGLHRVNKGTLEVNGKLVLLSGIGTGMLEELTIAENLYLYGAIYGLSRKKIQSLLPEILDWAELHQFVDAQFKTLSSGMQTRLGFSAMRHIHSDIFLLDEALTAGDRNFKEKCREYFEQSKKTDKTFLVSTHNLNFVKEFCSKTIWLHKGKLMKFGMTEDVLPLYEMKA